jgi:hypothetical protein
MGQGYLASWVVEIEGSPRRRRYIDKVAARLWSRNNPVALLAARPAASRARGNGKTPPTSVL